MFCSEEVLDLFWQWDRTACYLHWRDFVIGVGLCLQADARQAYPPSATLDVRGCCDRGASQADHAPACRGKGALLEGISKKELERRIAKQGQSSCSAIAFEANFEASSD